MAEKQDISRLIERLDTLEQKFSKLERQLAVLTHTRGPHADSPVLPLQDKTRITDTTPPSIPQSKTIAKKVMKPEWNLESVIAGRWLNRAPMGYRQPERDRDLVQTR